MAIILDSFGWDNGFGYEKFYTVYNDQRNKEGLTLEDIEVGLTEEEKKNGAKKTRFPSVILIPSGSGKFSNSFANNYALDKINIVFDGKEYMIGELAIRQDHRGGLRNYNSNKYKDVSEIAKLCSGLVLLFPDTTEIVINKLVLGLSIKVYSPKSTAEAIDIYKGKTFEVVVPRQSKDSGNIWRKKVKIRIEDVNLIPQGIGILQDVMLNNSGRVIDTDNLMNKRFGVLDIGTNTVDAFVRDGLSPVEDSEFALSYGTSDVFSRVAKILNLTNLENKIEQAYIEGKETIYFQGQNRSILSSCNNTFEIFGEEIYQMAYGKWNRYLDEIQYIVVSGGCIPYLAEHLKKLFAPTKIIVPDDPQYSNARGYYKYGLFTSLLNKLD